MTEERDLFKEQIKVINVGIREFMQSLIKQDVDAVHVDWRPPAKGNKELLDLLDKLI